MLSDLALTPVDRTDRLYFLFILFSGTGINFETIKVLALKYNLHPLAIEDALRAQNNPRSKIDFYAEHLYTQVSYEVSQGRPG
jgi:hypothetical protein